MKDYSNISYTVRTHCAVCERVLGLHTLAFPNLPLTEIYINHKPKKLEGFAHQYFHFCPRCGHGQLKHLVPKEILYTSDSYYLRTSQSGTARGANDVFARFIRKVVGKRTFGSLMEFGCSDFYLLDVLKDYSKHITGIDPILLGSEKMWGKKGLNAIGDYIEKIDLSSVLSNESNLILSSHTMEHIADPGRIIQLLLSRAKHEDVFIFQFPSLEPLVQDGSYDQIFHQHVHYFSLDSFSYLVDTFGGVVTDYEVNHTHWGSLMIAFRKRKSKTSLGQCKIPLTQKAITQGYASFQKSTKDVQDYLDSLHKEKVVGFGASLMLPILGYHLKSDFSEFDCILDDDKGKCGLYYINLPVKIRSPKPSESFREVNMVVTAYNTPRSVLPRILSLHPKRIIFTKKMI